MKRLTINSECLIALLVADVHPNDIASVLKISRVSLYTNPDARRHMDESRVKKEAIRQEAIKAAYTKLASESTNA